MYTGGKMWCKARDSSSDYFNFPNEVRIKVITWDKE